jgi:hypothetical protein
MKKKSWGFLKNGINNISSNSPTCRSSETRPEAVDPFDFTRHALMTAREIIGLVILIVGTAIVPLGWIISHKILLLAGLLIGVGAWLFYTERMLRREEQLSRESASSGNYGPPIPGDIHNYTGWRTGGRTESFDSTSSSEGGSDGD